MPEAEKIPPPTWTPECNHCILLAEMRRDERSGFICGTEGGVFMGVWRLQKRLHTESRKGDLCRGRNGQLWADL